MFDPNKPVQTRDGRRVEVLKTDVPLPGYSIVGIVYAENGFADVDQWTAEGHFFSEPFRDGDHSSDLVNIPERFEAYQNVYLKSVEGRPAGRVSTAAYPDEATADRMGLPNRIGLIRTVVEDGKLKRVELV